MSAATSNRFDNKRTEQAVLVARFSISAFFFCICFSPVLLLMDLNTAATTTAIFSVCILLSPLLMRVTGSPQVAGHALVLSIVCLITAATIDLGGASAPPITWFSAPAMAGVFLLGVRGGVVWAVISTTIVIALAISESVFDIRFVTSATSGKVLFLFVAGVITITGVAFTFFWQFDTTTRKALSAVQTANDRITRMIVHVEATSSALSRSAAEFLGAGVDSNGGYASRPRGTGLTQQMMMAASSGRSTIEQFGASLRGMIEQYNEISSRIAVLHKQSSIITDLVGTIDNISDRLDLMALNTGIEAAHAGESGKRFRLLADDMRRLAERVSAETTRIKSAIGQVKENTDATLEASRLGQLLTDHGSEQLDLTSGKLDEIYELIERTVEASQRITNDTTNQISAIRELASAAVQTQRV